MRYGGVCVLELAINESDYLFLNSQWWNWEREQEEEEEEEEELESFVSPARHFRSRLIRPRRHCCIDVGDLLVETVNVVL